MLERAIDKPLFVMVLVPSAETADPSIDYYSDYSQSREELARVFDGAGVRWQWTVVTLRTYRAAIDAFKEAARAYTPVVFNLCDGDEVNDVPGISVIHYLNVARLPYTGASAEFYRATTSKIDMKRAFDAANVSTPPWAVVGCDEMDHADVFDRLGAPLIVKPAVSAGSMGITVKSVVKDHASLRAQIRELHKGYRGWNLASGGVFVERFIEGRELTALIVGADSVYPPVERLFHASLPANERLLSYDRLWEVYERESRVGGDGEYLWEYGAAPRELHERVSAVSRAAYAAVGGCGYGRVDLRMNENGDLYVLEVNAQCGLSEDENYTSIGAILRLAEQQLMPPSADINGLRRSGGAVGTPQFSKLIFEVIVDALARHP